MTTVAIRAKNLSKRYQRGMAGTNSLLRDKLALALRSPLKLLRRKQEETFWALKEVSLEVKEGEVLGLIGRNGAGKTTLLKILSRITPPTTGWAEIHGRVGSLLEVGTGFHPELTGRENTYLSGAILGMRKAEIAKKFDEIVAFAELDKFIDTPVKHYSSGMYVRLAFAVAAHLEPEILLVDEVLAVGDINFQKKCLGKMGDVAKAGRTVVLVSHQMNQIRRLSHRVIWVDDGRIRRNGSPAEVVSAYEQVMSSGQRFASDRDVGAAYRARFISWEITKGQTTTPHSFTTLESVTLRFRLEVRQRVCHGTHGIALYNAERQLIWGRAEEGLELAPGIHDLFYKFPMLPLRPGAYWWLLSLWDDAGQVDMWDGIPEMIVATESHQHPRDEWSGVLNLPSAFHIVERHDS